MTRWMLAAVLMVPAAVVAAPQGLPGHYYLSGMTEVGSELLLRADGRYRWMLAYGALDLAVEGSWTRSGDTLTLVADPDMLAEDGMESIFARMELTIAKDGALVPVENLRGAYRKAE
ncbi:putative holin [Sphingomonas sp. PL-96]|uniref:putative holin n=1 Tax=Sphingomonas sp. PL-96 TaxID=2887201 RepID=UPI001E2E29C6|nr:putative holin [Sphingomonas sp. PL-96]MCC2977707.1 putative holin [Sphingomonas sp. PL-96]